MATRMIRTALTVMTLCAMVSFAAAKPSNSVAQFFKGKTIRVVAGTDAGGAYGVYAQLFARHFGKHVPGNPAVIVEYRPGAGGVVAANYLFSVAQKDGTVIGIPLAPFILAEYTDRSSVKYDVAKFLWIGQIAHITRLFAVWHTSKVKTFYDLITDETIAGSSGAGSETFMNPALMNHIFGTKIKIVTGYKGSEELMLSLERGETTAVSGTSSNFAENHPSWLKEGKIRFLVQIGFSKAPGYGNVPLLSDLAKNKADRQLIEFMSLVTTSVGYSVMAPPGVPDDIIAALRNAFDATMEDPAFVTDAKNLHADLSPADYRALEDAVTKVANSPQTLFERFAKAIQGS